MSTPSRHLRAPQATVIDKHPLRDSILKDLASERHQSDAVLARKYKISVASIRSYRCKIMAEYIAEHRKDRGLRTVDRILTKLEKTMDDADEISAAMKLLLRDPNDPTKLWMGLQAEEVVAHYDQDTGEKTKDGRPITRRKASQLSELVARLGQEGKSAFEFTVKRDDSRRIYLQTIETILKVADRLIFLQKLGGEVKEIVNRVEVVNVLLVEVLPAVEHIPGAKEAIVSWFEQKGLALEATPDDV